MTKAKQPKLSPQPQRPVTIAVIFGNHRNSIGLWIGPSGAPLQLLLMLSSAFTTSNLWKCTSTFVCTSMHACNSENSWCQHCCTGSLHLPLEAWCKLPAGQQECIQMPLPLPLLLLLPPMNYWRPTLGFWLFFLHQAIARFSKMLRLGKRSQRKMKMPKTIQKNERKWRKRIGTVATARHEACLCASVNINKMSNTLAACRWRSLPQAGLPFSNAQANTILHLCAEKRAHRSLLLTVSHPFASSQRSSPPDSHKLQSNLTAFYLLLPSLTQ